MTRAEQMVETAKKIELLYKQFNSLLRTQKDLKEDHQRKMDEIRAQEVLLCAEVSDVCEKLRDVQRETWDQCYDNTQPQIEALSREISAHKHFLTTLAS